jgi:predicted Rossmann fold flavoprotein
MTSTRFDSIILGAGAAGLFCAGVAGQRGKRVLVINQNDKPAEKIRISGGGRCNFTNLGTSAANFLSQNPDFCRSALARYTPQHFIALLQHYRVPYHEKTLGQLFCDRSAKDVIDLLFAECALGRVTLLYPANVTAVSRADCFCVETDRGCFESDTLIVATGGLSVPPTGATAMGYRIAEQFDVPVTPLRAGLVPLALDAPDVARFACMSGVSFDAVVSDERAQAKFRESVLITHRGLSGPAILQVSNYWQLGEELHVDLLPTLRAADLIAAARSSKATLPQLLSTHLPQRFADAWCAAYATDRVHVPLAQWTKQECSAITERLHAWTLRPSGTLGYKKAEVTLGGVDTRVLSSKTMMVNKIPGLFFIGEVVDVTGWLGGYNFQWAWASAFACGCSV